MEGCSSGAAAGGEATSTFACVVFPRSSRGAVGFSFFTTALGGFGFAAVPNLAGLGLDGLGGSAVEDRHDDEGDADQGSACAGELGDADGHVVFYSAGAAEVSGAGTIGAGSAGWNASRIQEMMSMQAATVMQASATLKTGKSMRRK